MRAGVYQSRAYSLQMLGRRDEALADYTRAIRLDPRQAVAYAWRGVIHDEMRDWPAAMDDYSNALRLDPNLGGVLERRGSLFYERNEWDKALADYNESIRARPDDPTLYADCAPGLCAGRQERGDGGEL